MLARYNQLLRKRPVLVNTLTGTTLCFVGDLAVQGASQRVGSAECGGDGQDGDSSATPPIDLRRTAFFTAFGGAWAGPVNVAWFGLLERRFPAATGGKRAVLRKLALQHGLLNPLIYVPAFLGYWGFTMGHNAPSGQHWRAGAYELGAARAKITDEWWGTIKKVWAVWIPVTAVMFAAVPLLHQPLYIAAVSLGWNSNLSFFANSAAAGDRGKGTEALAAATAPAATGAGEGTAGGGGREA